MQITFSLVKRTICLVIKPEQDSSLYMKCVEKKAFYRWFRISLTFHMSITLTFEVVQGAALPVVMRLHRYDSYIWLGCLSDHGSFIWTHGMGRCIQLSIQNHLKIHGDFLLYLSISFCLCTVFWLHILNNLLLTRLWTTCLSRHSGATSAIVKGEQMNLDLVGLAIGTSRLTLVVAPLYTHAQLSFLTV